jgi:hypothetical protein
MTNSSQAKERRRVSRFDAAAIPGFKYASRIGGQTVKLINISRGGALIESRERISAGTSIALRLNIEKDTHFIRGRILRSRTIPTRGRLYQSAIAFREDLTIIPASMDLI